MNVECYGSVGIDPGCTKSWGRMNHGRVEEERKMRKKPCRDLAYRLSPSHLMEPQEGNCLQSQDLSHFCSQEALSFYGILFFLILFL